jgi:NNMT/PNMT/TEMT family
MADRDPSIRNGAAAWSDFDADEYWKINYASLLPEDVEIIQCASKFLIEACGVGPGFKRAVDVGAGTNLYPALLMLPWVEHIVLTEYASPNIGWLRESLADASGEWQWQPFWDLVAGLPCYRAVEQPRRRLAAVHEIRTLSIFDLPARAWDLGSMFFVADGMTTDEAEFEAATRSFLNALKPGSPFLMAFMEGSSGYDVHGLRFPAVKVTPRSLDALLADLPVAGTSVLRTDNSIRRVRLGYDAMLLVTGFATVLRGRFSGLRRLSRLGRARGRAVERHDDHDLVRPFLRLICHSVPDYHCRPPFNIPCQTATQAGKHNFSAQPGESWLVTLSPAKAKRRIRLSMHSSGCRAVSV